MAFRRVEEIRAWQLSMELQRELIAVFDREPACRDFKCCTEGREAAASAARNIAEGFGRFGDKEFANFLRIARGSQLETQTNLKIAKDRGFITPDEFKRLWALSEESVATTTGLLKSIDRRIKAKRR